MPKPPRFKPLNSGFRLPRAEQRGSSNARGYGRRWQRFRAWYLNRNPLCYDCLATGVTKAATDVHHKVKVVDDSSLMYDPANVMALCHECHSKRTARGE